MLGTLRDVACVPRCLCASPHAAARRGVHRVARLRVLLRRRRSCWLRDVARRCSGSTPYRMTRGTPSFGTGTGGCARSSACTQRSTEGGSTMPNAGAICWAGDLRGTANNQLGLVRTSCMETGTMTTSTCAQHLHCLPTCAQPAGGARVGPGVKGPAAAARGARGGGAPAGVGAARRVPHAQATGTGTVLPALLPAMPCTARHMSCWHRQREAGHGPLLHCALSQSGRSQHTHHAARAHTPSRSVGKHTAHQLPARPPLSAG